MVGFNIAGVADAVAVSIGLVGIGEVSTVVAGVAKAVAVRVGSAARNAAPTNWLTQRASNAGYTSEAFKAVSLVSAAGEATALSIERGTSVEAAVPTIGVDHTDSARLLLNDTADGANRAGCATYT